VTSFSKHFGLFSAVSQSQKLWLFAACGVCLYPKTFLGDEFAVDISLRARENFAKVLSKAQSPELLEEEVV
jgi:hypothetical protein